jgi:hypothetical protein
MNRTTLPIVYALLGAVAMLVFFFVWRRMAAPDRMRSGTTVLPTRPAPTASAPREPTDFRVEFLAELRKQFPSQKFDLDSDDSARITSGDCQINLNNLWKRFQKTDMSRDALRGIVKDCEPLWHLSASGREKFPQTYEEAKHRLVPQIIQEAMPSGNEQVRIPFAGTVVVVIVLDGERTYSYVTRETLAMWGKTAEAVYADALENLHKRSVGMQLRQFQNLGSTFFAIGMHDGFDAARITLPQLKNSLGGKLGFPFYFGIPNRDFLICWSAAGGKEVLQFARDKLKRDYAAQPYPLSGSVFQVATDGTISTVNEPENPTQGGKLQTETDGKQSH